MSRRYFDLTDDMSLPGRWMLGDFYDERGEKLPDWIFEEGQRVHVDGRIRIPIYMPGQPLDFSLTQNIPVVHAKVATAFADLAPDDIQLLPVEIESQKESYFIVNVLRVVRCIDDRASEEVVYWRPEDGRPDKTGTYRSVFRMRIDPSKVGDAKVFRTWGWEVVMVVAEEIKDALERAGVTGAKFEEV